MFDGIGAVHAKVADASPDRPSLLRLAEVLEDPKLWPEGFVWNYKYHDNCAMGLANRLWPRGFDAISNMLRYVYFGEDLTYSIFMGLRHRNFGFITNYRMAAVTPKDVAQQIRKVLASHPDVS